MSLAMDVRSTTYSGHSHAIRHTTHIHSQAHSEQRTTHTQYTRHAATAPTRLSDVNHCVFLNYNFSKEQCMVPEDDRMIETRGVL